MPATLRQIRAAVKATLVTFYAGTGIQVYDVVPGAIVAPAVIIEPGSGDYQQTLGSTDRTDHTLAVHAVVGLGDREAAQNKLDELISASGSQSIAAGIASDRTLGGVVEWSNARGYRDYGTRSFADTAYLMASVDVETFGPS